MRRRIIVLLSTFFAILNLSAQVTFQKTLGCSGQDNPVWGHQRMNGDYFIAGNTQCGAGNLDIYLISLNKNGTLKWTKTYGAANSDGIESACLTATGGYMLVGSSRSFNGATYDLYITKIDSAGTIIWSKTYDGGMEEGGKSVIGTSDDEFLITAQRSGGTSLIGKTCLLKIDGNGNIKWSKTISGTTYVTSGIQTDDGGFLILGDLYYTNSQSHTFLVKTDSIGTLVWAKEFDFQGSESLWETLNGYSIGTPAGLLRVDTSGTPVNSWYFPGRSTYHVSQTFDNHYVFSGESAQDFSAFLAKTDSTGNVLFAKSYDLPAQEEGRFVIQTADGGFFIAGVTHGGPFGFSPDIYLIKTDVSANSGCNDADINVSTSPVTILSSNLTPQIDTIVFTVLTVNLNVGSGGVLSTLCTSVGVAEISSVDALVEIYPNPANNEAVIITDGQTYTSATLYDGIGNKLVGIKLIKRKNSFPTTSLPNGVYHLELRGEAVRQVRKFVVQH
jgi:hypothetical protein